MFPFREYHLSMVEMAIGSKQTNASHMRGHVGLRNLGSTCYLNSVFQQLFAIDNFQQSLLTSNFEDGSVSNSLQSLFWKMRLTKRPYVDTADFCKIFKFNDGDDLNVYQQQDATEFFTRLMDILEEDIKTTSAQNFIKTNFVGSTKTRMTCNACGHTIDKEQEINCLQMEVKNRANVVESLDAYTSTEALSGYKCESCGQRDTTKKQCLLGDLPPVLFMSLKRFELNYETFTREKVNTRYAFPEELELQKYMHETHWPTDLDNERSSKYSLSGIIIHSGQATAGHYYSFIRRADGSWEECNDLKNISLGYAFKNGRGLLWRSGLIIAVRIIPFMHRNPPPRVRICSFMNSRTMKKTFGEPRTFHSLFQNL